MAMMAILANGGADEGPRLFAVSEGQETRAVFRARDFDVVDRSAPPAPPPVGGDPVPVPRDVITDDSNAAMPPVPYAPPPPQVPLQPFTRIGRTQPVDLDLANFLAWGTPIPDPPAPGAPPGWSFVGEGTRSEGWRAPDGTIHYGPRSSTPWNNADGTRIVDVPPMPNERGNTTLPKDIAAQMIAPPVTVNLSLPSAGSGAPAAGAARASLGELGTGQLVALAIGLGLLAMVVMRAVRK